jgi:hypothetical protein
MRDEPRNVLLSVRIVEIVTFAPLETLGHYDGLPLFI